MMVEVVIFSGTFKIRGKIIYILAIAPKI